MRNLAVQQLMSTGWLAEQPETFRATLIGLGRLVRLGRGQPIYAMGDSPDAVFGLGTGLVDVSLPISDEEEVVIHRAGPGFWIGDSALLAQTVRALTIRAVTECEVLRVPGPAIRAHLAEHPEDWVCFFRLSHRNAVAAAQVLAEVLSLPPRARFARTLLRMAGPDGVVPATQEDLARMAGMSRASFRRAVAELIAGGIVQTGYGALRIIDRARLEVEGRVTPGW